MPRTARNLAALIGVWFVIPMLIAAAEQRTVKVSDPWLKVTGSAQPTAGVTIENGTMYDIYIVGAESDAAGTIEIVQSSAGKAVAVKELSVPAFGSVVMSPDSDHLVMRDLKGPLKSGAEVTIVLITDGGERLSTTAVVK